MTWIGEYPLVHTVYLDNKQSLKRDIQGLQANYAKCNWMSKNKPKIYYKK